MKNNTELLKNSAVEIVKTGIEEIADNTLGKLSFGLFTAAMTARNKLIADKLIQKLENSKIELADELIQSNEFLGYTSKILLALSTSTKQKKFDYLMNVYINGISNEYFINRSDKYSEVIDIISSLSEDSINVMIELHKFYSNEILITDKNNNPIPYISQKLNMAEADILATCYLLSGKGLVLQQPLYGSGFAPLQSSWLEDIIELLEDKTQSM